MPIYHRATSAAQNVAHLKNLFISLSVDQVLASCNGLVSLAPLPPQALTSTDLDPSNPDLTLYCSSPITTDDYSPAASAPGPGSHQSHEDLFNLPLGGEAGAGIFFSTDKDFEATTHDRKFSSRDPILSSKFFCSGMLQQQQQQQQQQHHLQQHLQHQQQQRRLASFGGGNHSRDSSPFSIHPAFLNGSSSTPTPPPPPGVSGSFPGMKFLSEDEMADNFPSRISVSKIPALKEEPTEADVGLQISMYNL